ncbi:MAG: nuclear transport factor 2 family protein [Chthoniobacterales bacterium]
MKKLISYSTIALLATIAISIAAPSKDEIMAKEKAAWQAFKDKKPADFKKVVDHDIVAVYSDGIAGMKKELSDMKKWDMKSFAISDYKAISDEPDVMVTSYIVTIEGTYNGKDASGTYNAGSVWKIENGNWLAIFHSNVKQEAAAKPAK